MELSIEPMAIADLPDALRIDVASFPEPPARREQQLREELERTWARLRVARAADGVAVGYVLFWHVADEIHLLNVAVAPEARRRGIGRALVEAVLAYARTNLAAKTLLEVRASNAAAIALYEGLGFERFNVRRRYYDDGEDGVEMMLRG